jgi:AcrR family transcriptional regulator
MTRSALRGRDRLLEVARELLAEGGPRAVTVQGIAARAGVSAPSLYKHFDGRDELVRALQAEGWEEFRRAIAPSMRATSPLARLRKCGRLYVEFGLDRPHVYRLLFASDEAGLAPAGPEPKTSPGLAFLVALVADCQRSGALPKRANPEDLALAFWATSHGLVALYLQGGGEPRFGRARYLAMSRRALTALTRS